MDDTIEKSVLKEFRRVSYGVPLNELGRIFIKNTFVLVENKFIATNFDLLNFMKDKC